MKRLSIVLLLISPFFSGCEIDNKKVSIEELKGEILNTEQEFAAMAKLEGVAVAFLYYADEQAVLNRNNIILSGKSVIKTYFENQTFKEINLQWKPDFVDVAASGDLGYTYGQYTFSAVDKNGEIINDKGIFHTVWKRQNDGSWRFVWD